jgi:hypothetical protein
VGDKPIAEKALFARERTIDELMTNMPGARCSRSEPTALTEITSVTPKRFNASMLARKLMCDGGMRWPRPWRGRKAISFSANFPSKISSEGLPKDDSTRVHFASRRPSMLETPLPPMTASKVGLLCFLRMTLQRISMRKHGRSYYGRHCIGHWGKSQTACAHFDVLATMLALWTRCW